MKHLFFAAAYIGLFVVPALGAPPPVGVYGCYGPYGKSLPSVFGLLDPSQYANFDGKTGHYVMKGDLLVMIDGPLKEIQYKRIGEQAFRMLDDKGALTSFVCPKEGTKDPHKHPW